MAGQQKIKRVRFVRVEGTACAQEAAETALAETAAPQAAAAAGSGSIRKAGAYILAAPAKLLAEPRPKLWLYMDYNGVLNGEGVMGILDFVVALNHLNDIVDLNITLVSHRGCEVNANGTLNEIADAGVLDLFDQFVFTKRRRSMPESHVGHGRPVRASVMEFYYVPFLVSDWPPLPEHAQDREQPDEDRKLFCNRQRNKFAHMNIKFDLVYGGKDQFIYSQHAAPPATEMLRRFDMLRGAEPKDRIVFVDDKAETLDAVLALEKRPEFRGSVQCIEMRRRVFRSGERARHANNLNGLYVLIRRSAQELLDNHAALRSVIDVAPRSWDPIGLGAAPRSGAAQQESGAAERSGAAPRSREQEESWDALIRRAEENYDFL